MTKEEKRLFMFRVRMESRLTGTEFGELVGLSPSYICHLENKRRVWDDACLANIKQRAAEAGILKAAKVQQAIAHREEKRVALMALRKAIGLNQEGFSDVLGVVGPTVNANEKGHHEWEEVMFTEAAGAAVRYLAARYQRDLRAVEEWRGIYHPEK